MNRIRSESPRNTGPIPLRSRWLFAVLLAATTAITAQAATRKPRIAVMDFDYATVETATMNLFGWNVDVGKGVTRLVAANLGKDGTYSVVERDALDAVVAEQSFSSASRKDVAEAVRIGKLLDVDVIVVGSVTEFGAEPRKIGLAGKLTGLALSKIKPPKMNAEVEIDARLIDVRTGEILAAMMDKGTSMEPGPSLLGDEDWSGGVNLGASDFQRTILGEATRAAVNKLTTDLVVDAEKIAVRTLPVEGLVAAVDAGQIVLNVGSNTGLKTGDRLEVRRVTQEIRDPATGAVIRRLSDAVGVVAATDVNEASALCVPVSGKDFKAGDTVQLMTH